MTSFIPLSVPTLTGRERLYIDECLETNWVSSAGRYVSSFAELCAQVGGARYAVPVVNGTAALHLAVELAGVRPDEEVVIPALTFIGTANGVRHAGAQTAVLDVDPNTWQLDPERLAEFLREACEKRRDGVYNRTTGRRVSAIMPVHLLGHPCDMDPILALADEFGLVVIEDAAEAVGAAYKGRPVGGIGRLGCFSFNGNKTFTCGGGGAILTNDADLAKRGEYLSTQAKDDPVLFIHKQVGYNYRLTNLQAAMGVAQLEAREAYLARKKAINRRYRQRLADVPGIGFMESANWADDAMWLTTVRVDAAKTRVSNLDLMRQLGQGTNGGPKIETRLLWQPMHRSQALAGGYRAKAPVADAIYAEALSLPSSVRLTDAEQDLVIAALLQRLGGG